MPRKPGAKERAMILLARGYEEREDGAGGRELHLLTHAEVAHAVGVTPQTISTWLADPWFIKGVMRRLERESIRYTSPIVRKLFQLAMAGDVQAARTVLEVNRIIGPGARIRYEAEQEVEPPAKKARYDLPPMSPEKNLRILNVVRRIIEIVPEPATGEGGDDDGGPVLDAGEGEAVHGDAEGAASAAPERGGAAGGPQDHWGVRAGRPITDV